MFGVRYVKREQPIEYHLIQNSAHLTKYLLKQIFLAFFGIVFIVCFMFKQKDGKKVMVGKSMKMLFSLKLKLRGRDVMTLF